MHVFPTGISDRARVNHCRKAMNYPRLWIGADGWPLKHDHVIVSPARSDGPLHILELTTVLAEIGRKLIICRRECRTDTYRRKEEMPHRPTAIRPVVIRIRGRPVGEMPETVADLQDAGPLASHTTTAEFAQVVVDRGRLFPEDFLTPSNFRVWRRR